VDESFVWKHGDWCLFTFPVKSGGNNDGWVQKKMGYKKEILRCESCKTCGDLASGKMSDVSMTALKVKLKFAGFYFELKPMGKCG
jgi:hypothetical protein